MKETKFECIKGNYIFQRFYPNYPDKKIVWITILKLMHQDSNHNGLWFCEAIKIFPYRRIVLKTSWAVGISTDERYQIMVKTKEDAYDILMAELL